MNKSDYLSIRKDFHFSPRPFFLIQHLITDVVIVAVILFLVFKSQDHTAFLVPAIIGLSVLMFRNFSLMHEGVHNLIIKDRTLNDAVGTWAGALCLLPFQQWKEIHLDHHSWSGNVDKDPAMGLVKTFPRWPNWLKNLTTAAWRMWFPLIAMLQYCVFWYESLRSFRLKNFTAKRALSLGFPIVFWFSVGFALPMGMISLLLVPSVLLYLVAVEVVNFPHHLGGLPQYYGDKKLPLWNQHEIARSCLYPSWLAKWVVLNFNYHIEHHMFPDAPWYFLPKLKERVYPILMENYNTDPQFGWILKNRPKSIGEVLVTQMNLSSEASGPVVTTSAIDVQIKPLGKLEVTEPFAINEPAN